MRSIKVRLATLAFCISAVLHTHAQGFIVTDGVFSGGNGGGGQLFVVRQNATNSDYTGMIIYPAGVGIFQFGSVLDEGVRMFLVNANDPISFAAIQANSYTELLYPDQHQIPNGADFYVGLYTGYNPWVQTTNGLVYTGVYSSPVFGWAELYNNNGTIQLVESALAFNSPGIYAGTTTIIPEPSVFGLFGLGALLLGLLRRKKAA